MTSDASHAAHFQIEVAKESHEPLACCYHRICSYYGIMRLKQMVAKPMKWNFIKIDFSPKYMYVLFSFITK